MNWILDVQDAALVDGEYQRRYQEYQAANDRLTALTQILPEEQTQIIWDFLECATLLYHRIMEIAHQM